jgi:DNA topoisomerase-1
MQPTGVVGLGSGWNLKFDGWLKLYGVKQVVEEEQEKTEEEEKKQVLPNVEQGENLTQKEVTPSQHFTQPPPRYTEASLVKKLEELGIGRPSTYAPIISTIQDRFYVEREERRFKATPLGMAVNDFLMKYFSDVFDYEFTASMEDRLDEVSRGEREWKKTIGDFFRPLEKKIAATGETAEKVALEVEKVDRPCPKCGKDLVVRTGKFGKFLACSGFPDCKHTEPIIEQIDAKCPQDGGDIMVRKTKKGKTFYGCKNWPKCTFASWTKPVAAKDTAPTESA